MLGQKKIKGDSSFIQILQLKNSALQHVEKKQFSNALVDLNKAYRISVFTNLDSIKYEVKFNIAQLHYQVHNFVKANTEIDIALSILTEKKQPLAYASGLKLKGLLATQFNNFNEADNYFSKADSIYKSVNNLQKHSQILLDLGVLDLQRKKYDKAITSLDEALAFFNTPSNKDIDNSYYIAKALLIKAEILIKQDNSNIKKAEKNYTQALNILQNNTIPTLDTKKYLIASLIDQVKGNSKNALENYKKHIESKESTYIKYFDAISNGADEESNLGDLKETIEHQQTKLEKDQKSMSFIIYTTGLGVTLIVILSLLTLSLYKINNLKAKANNLLIQKNSELQAAKEKAEKASVAKAQFLSTVSHELRTPLYAVTGLTHLLLDENPEPKQKEHLDSLKFSGEYLLSLINNLLDLNKLEAKKTEVEYLTFNLEKQIRDVIDALKNSAQDKNNKVTLDFDNELPDKIVGDPIKLSQILMNLIGNSLKFTQNGFVTIRVKKNNEDDKNINIKFEIEDNGIGISKKKRSTIFESFSQGSLQVNRKYGGTGLGLSIVKNILKLMNSDIHLESTLGQGSKFWFNITFKKHIDRNVKPISQSTNEAIDFSVFKNKKILVVEDNKINQMITRKILEKHHVNCQIIDNGVDAIKLIEKNSFEVVLMDIHMPGISGIETTQLVRKFDKKTPILALTAVTADENKEEFYNAGFNDIIPKPFTTELFFEKIYKAISKSETTI
ncbi:Signal transduction histidine kinase-like protein [unidentified eubacterium SCB49]|nr:Signal transduction histidine kinase-like protein [unidentified eubacterium SCB49]